jgi:acetyltransferase
MNETLVKENRKRSIPEIGDNKSDLRPFFAPRSVAVIGASPKKGNLGKYIVQSLLNQQFPGSVVTVHPAGNAVADCPVVKDISSLPNTVDLAIVAVSASKTLPLLKPLAAKGVHHLIIISGGF